MEWMSAIQEAISYIEKNITDEKLNADQVAEHVFMSSFYFQKGFTMLCGYTVGEYIRNRRLDLAGKELVHTDTRIIDVSMKYGYDSPDSFSKAFTRFHGVRPSQIRKEEVILKSFAPLKLKISLEGGYLMDYKIRKKGAFSVVGIVKRFPYEGAYETIPLFWKDCMEEGIKVGNYGINIDENMEGVTFEYVIANDYKPSEDVPEGMVIRTIPALTWAVFPCYGALPSALQEVNQKIFNEWLPAMKEYEFSQGYCIEYYDDPHKYKNGAEDENYYSEIWLPIRLKEEQ